MERGQRLKNAVVLRHEMKKIRQKGAECIIFTHQDFPDGGALIKLYAIEQRCRITTEGDRHLFFSDGPVEERVEVVEVEEMAEEVVELANLTVLGEDEVGFGNAARCER